MSDNAFKLGLFVITYNRSALLKTTLGYLAASPLAGYPITVLNNASTDDTVATVEGMKPELPRLRLINNEVNVGPNVNFLRAFDYAEHEYTWVLCDDDDFDLSHFDDVLATVDEGAADLIHLGSNRQTTWIAGGSTQTPQQLLANLYPYFKYASFMPCNIFKTKVFVKEYLVKAYNNVGNSYPHMAYVNGMYLENRPVYVARQQVAFARETGQSYEAKEWFLWWMKTCEMLAVKSKAAVKMAYLTQFKNNGVVSDRPGFHALELARKIGTDKDYLDYFIKKYFTLFDRLALLLVYRTGLMGLRDKLFWLRQRWQK